MTPDAVADVGNSRIKWGLCENGRVTRSAALSPDDFKAWRQQAESWNLTSPRTWAVAGVHPARRDQLADWLRGRGDKVLVVDDPRLLPLRVLLERPDHVGIDRLLDAVAANSRRVPGVPAIVIDAGTAVTVDWIDGAGAFRGGAILPGPRLMAQSLHDYTALLPLVEVPRRVPALPGTATIPAIEAGIFWAVAGGIKSLVEVYESGAGTAAQLFLTGGDAAVLLAVLGTWGVHHYWPDMTLEGSRLTAEAQP
jgi:type III pantothenate kinase